MLQLVLGLVSIGLILYFWEVFPSFKWVLLVIVLLPTIGIFVVVMHDYNIKSKKEKEQVESQQRHDQEIKVEEAQKNKKNYELLSRLKTPIESRIKDNNYTTEEEKEKDIVAVKELEVLITEAKRKLQ